MNINFNLWNCIIYN